MYAVLAFVGLGFLLFIIAVGIVADDLTHPTVCCVVIAEKAPVHVGPSEIYKKVDEKSGGLVNVVGSVGNWWKLTDGNYMPARCLTPMRSGEMPVEIR